MGYLPFLVETGVSMVSGVGGGETIAGVSPMMAKLLTVLIFLLWGSLNVALNFFCKWAMGKLKDSVDHQHTAGLAFGFPFFFTMFHMIAGIGGSRLLMIFAPPASGLPSLSQFKEYWK